MLRKTTAGLDLRIDLKPSPIAALNANVKTPKVVIFQWNARLSRGQLRIARNPDVAQMGESPNSSSVFRRRRWLLAV